MSAFLAMMGNANDLIGRALEACLSPKEDLLNREQGEYRHLPCGSRALCKENPRSA